MSARARVLVLGSGGREHALCYGLAQSPEVAHVICAPGNDGMESNIERWPARLTQKESFTELADRALAARVDLVVVGPDDPLALGITDVFAKAGLRVFGPTQAAAQLEWSKSFAKEILRDVGAPTARGVTVRSFEEAERFLRSVVFGQTSESGWVVKADGLALGKGVVVCSRLDQALSAAAQLIAVSGSLVIEEKVTGEELSWIAFCDGSDFRLLEPARDHKRRDDLDLGPNTGGMGAYSPVEGIPSDLKRRVSEQIFAPVLRAMKARGAPFVGALYAGLMWNRATDALWVIEFNARMGDPETQVLVPRLGPRLYSWLEASASGKLGSLGEIEMTDQASVAVVLASPGYPDSPQLGELLGDLSQVCAPTVFFAGVRQSADASSPSHGHGLVASGGRVLAVQALGDSVALAAEMAYQTIQKLKLPRLHYRRDIGRQAP